MTFTNMETCEHEEGKHTQSKIMGILDNLDTDVVWRATARGKAILQEKWKAKLVTSSGDPKWCSKKKFGDQKW